MNFIEQLAAEWYEWQGYFVLRNQFVGLLQKGGWECELDIVAFSPSQNRLVHVECSNDASSWAIREKRFKKKFDAGQKHIPNMFNGLQLPPKIEKIALLRFASAKNHKTLAGGKVVTLKDFMGEIIGDMRESYFGRNHIVPERLHTLRTIYYAHFYFNETTFL